MRIISTFRDYYDGLSSHDKEDLPVWVRETREVPVESIPGFPRGLKEFPNPPYNGRLSRFCLSIAGRCFLGYCSHWTVYWTVPEVLADVEALTFLPHRDENEMVLFSRQDQVGLRDAYRDLDRRRGWEKSRTKHYDGSYRFTPEGWSAYLKSRADVRVPDKAILAADSPLFYWVDSPRKIVTINPDLKSLGLTGVMPVQKLFQEIEMCLGSTLAKQMDPTTTRTQEDIRDSKGFDDRSFKAGSPSEKKSRRRERKKSRRGNGDTDL